MVLLGMNAVLLAAPAFEIYVHFSKSSFVFETFFVSRGILLNTGATLALDTHETGIPRQRMNYQLQHSSSPLPLKLPLPFQSVKNYSALGSEEMEEFIDQKSWPDDSF